LAVDKFGFVEAVYSFSEGIVIRVTDAAVRWFYTRIGQTLGVSDGQILPAASIDAAGSNDGRG
jgi:hypothetical protein